MKDQVLAVLQARMSSSRLPGKVMALVNGKPVIYWQIKRILKSKYIDKLVVVTSTDSSDDVLSNYLASEGIDVYRGSLENVFSRFLEVTNKYNPSSIVRLTADCPLIMPQVIDLVIEAGLLSKCDYLSNTLIPSFPDGLDTEYISRRAIEVLSKLNLTQQEKEHVTLGIYGRADIFEVQNYMNDTDLGSYRWTLDTEEDLKFLRFVFTEFLNREQEFDFSDMLQLYKEYPEKFIIKPRASITFPTIASIFKS
jgi:spore coat polysaccharide biosynthesis protein SpsF